MRFKKSRGSGRDGNYRGKDTVHIGKRKAARKAAEREHGRAAAYFGGVLHFLDTLEPVPGTPQIFKPGSKAIGMLAAKPPAEPKELSWSQQAARDDAERRRPSWHNEDSRALNSMSRW